MPVIATACTREGNKETELLLFPNPATNDLAVNYYTSEDEDVVIRIFDMPGKVVTTREQAMPAGENISFFNISQLQGGMYFIEINNGEKSVTKKFMVAN